MLHVSSRNGVEANRPVRTQEELDHTDGRAQRGHCRYRGD